MSHPTSDAQSKQPEALPEHRIIDEFDELLEIDESATWVPFTEAGIRKWAREFRTN